MMKRKLSWTSLLVLGAMGCGETASDASSEIMEPTTRAHEPATEGPTADTGSDHSGPEPGAAAPGESDAESPDPHDFGAGPWDLGWEIPAEPYEKGDPELGRKRLFEGAYMSCGVPWALTNVIGEEAFLGLLGGGVTDSSNAQGLPRETGGRPAEGPAKDLPYMASVFTASDGAQVAGSNCLLCHAGRFNGEFILGLGAADYDFTVAPGGPIEGKIDPTAEATARLFVFLTRAERNHLAKFLARTGAIAGIRMRTIGNNPAQILASVLGAHHDPLTLEWSDEPVVPLTYAYPDGTPIEEPGTLTSDPPPWWRAHKKHAHFYNAMSRGDHRGTMGLSTGFCVDTVEEAEKVNAIFKDIQTYIETLRAPTYPFAIDDALASQGAALFRAKCAGCHGTYDADESKEWYPNLLIPLEEIGSDPAIAEAPAIYAAQLTDWFNGSYYGTITRMVPDDPFIGYIAPPLDGIWATGPFMHNGSVPTVELMLNSKARPTYWRRVDLDSKNFDQDKMGFAYRVLDHGQHNAPEGTEELNMIYDTTFFGQTNGGHTYGDDLTDAQRRAVIEYLKTL